MEKSSSLFHTPWLRGHAPGPGAEGKSSAGNVPPDGASRSTPAPDQQSSHRGRGLEWVCAEHESRKSVRAQRVVHGGQGGCGSSREGRDHERRQGRVRRLPFAGLWSRERNGDIEHGSKDEAAIASPPDGPALCEVSGPHHCAGRDSRGQNPEFATNRNFPRVGT